MTVDREPAFRATELFPPRSLQLERRADGSLLLSSGPTPDTMPPTVAALLAQRAGELGGKSFIAERDSSGEWRHQSYAAFKASTDAVASWLLARARAGIEDRILVISGNSTAHAELVFGAGSAGVPVCPVSAQYALSPTGEFGRLRHVLALLRPTLVFAEYAAPVRAALAELAGTDARVICRDPDNCPENLSGSIAWEEVRSTPAAAGLEAAIERIDPDAPFRFMLTSGSTGLPKVVVQTNRMWMSLVASATEVMGRVSGWNECTLDWMPWSHVAGASVVLGTLANGGTFYLDGGRPVGPLFGATLKNLAEVQPRFFANVPLAFGMLCDALEGDPELRRAFFDKLQLCLYGGAGLSQPVYDRFQAMAEETIGCRIMFTTGYGSTETTAGVMSITWPTTRVGVGLPLPGIEAKLIPIDGERYEVRFRGEAVMPGYFNNPEATAKAFDEEGFYRSGDSLTFIDPDRPEEGLAFAGRLAEEFKLSNGTFVPGGRLHNEALAATQPVAMEVLVCGEGRDEAGLLFWISPEGCARELGIKGDVAALAADERVLDWISARLAKLNARPGGAAVRIGRFGILLEPPVVDAGEMSDKGSINQSISLRRRAADVERLYAADTSDRVLQK